MGNVAYIVFVTYIIFFQYIVFVYITFVANIVLTIIDPLSLFKYVKFEAILTKPEAYEPDQSRTMIISPKKKRRNYFAFINTKKVAFPYASEHVKCLVNTD